MTYKYGDVVLVKFPFSNFQYSKPRPGVVISSPRYNQLRKDVILQYLGRLSNKDRKTLSLCIRTIIGNDSH